MSGEGSRYAVVVGVSDYAKAEIADLQFAANDAARLAQVLIDKAGFPRENVRLFCDRPDAEPIVPGRVPAHSDILSATQEFAEAARAEDLLLFFFAGHGNEISETPYLLTNDTRLNVIRDTALPVELIRDYLDGSAARCTLRLFDACRAAQSAARGITLRPMSDRFGTALLHVPGGSVTFAACSSGEYAHEHPDLRQGVFSYYICQGLSGFAARDDGLVTIERLVDYVKLSVANECERRQLKQTPQFAGQTTGAMILASLAGRKSATVSAPNATATVASLASFLQEFHGTREAAVAHARVTSESELAALKNQFFDFLGREFVQLESVSFKVTASEPMNLQNLSSGAFRQLLKAVEATGLRPLWSSDEVPAQRFDLNSPAAYIPRTVFVFAVVRFSYFYWLWVSCEPEPPSESMRPILQPPHVRDYSTILSTALDDPERAVEAAASLLRRATDALQAWSKQCAEQIGVELKKLSDGGRLFH